MKEFKFKQIGIIRTPYQEKAPYQPITDDQGVFQLIIDEQYLPALEGLDKFKYIFVFSFLDRITPQGESLTVSPPWVENVNVGVFASRSPNRPNPIGLSIVRLKKIKQNIIYTSGLDVFDNTPLLDIKPYIHELDEKKDANYGWLEFKGRGDREHLLKHIKGVPH